MIAIVTTEEMKDIPIEIIVVIEKTEERFSYDRNLCYYKSQTPITTDFGTYENEGIEIFNNKNELVKSFLGISVTVYTQRAESITT